MFVLWVVSEISQSEIKDDILDFWYYRSIFPNCL